MESNNNFVIKLENEVDRLRAQGRETQVKILLEAIDLLKKNSPIQAAMALLAAEKRVTSNDAIAFCLLAAELFYAERGFQLAIIALETAKKNCAEEKDFEKIAKIDCQINRIELDIPHNFEECFVELERQLKTDQLEVLKRQTEADMIKFHSGLGLYWS